MAKEVKKENSNFRGDFKRKLSMKIFVLLFAFAEALPLMSLATFVWLTQEIIGFKYSIPMEGEKN